jgi:flagellar biosynthesis protein FlhG
VTSAYANMKLLSQRHGLMAFDLLLVAAASSPRTPRIAEQIAATADRFAWAPCCTTGPPSTPPPRAPKPPCPPA